MERTTRRSAAAAASNGNGDKDKEKHAMGPTRRRRGREVTSTSTNMSMIGTRHHPGSSATPSASEDGETDSGVMEGTGNGNASVSVIATRATARDKKKKQLAIARAAAMESKRRRKRSIPDEAVAETEAEDKEKEKSKEKESIKANGTEKENGDKEAHQMDKESASGPTEEKKEVDAKEEKQEADKTEAHGAESDGPEEKTEEHGSEPEQDHEHDHEHDHEGERVLRRSTRHERSMSVVSTASSTSSSASDPTEEDRMTLWAEKLVELEEKKKKVEDGTHPEYLRRLADYKEEHDGLLQAAESQKTLQTKNYNDLYEFEIKRAHCVWKDMKEAVKAELVEKADTVLAKLRSELAQLEATGELPKARANREVAMKKKAATSSPSGVEQTESATSASTSEEDGDDSAAGTKPPESKRRKTTEETKPMIRDVRLPLDAITDDIMTIAAQRDAASVRVHSMLQSPEIDLVIDRRQIICGKYVFEEGDEVVITSAVLKEDVNGTITSVDDEEIFVKLANGPKVRILVAHLATRRCEMRPFLRGSAGLEMLQSNGWVECEPF